MTARPPQTAVKIASGLSSHPRTDQAAAQVCAEIGGALGSVAPDVLLAFFSNHHSGRAAELGEALRRELKPGCFVAVSAESVIGAGVELERVPGVSAMALSLAGGSVHAFTSEDLPSLDGSAGSITKLSAAMHAGKDLRAVLLFADPYSVPLVNLLPAMNKARAMEGRAPVGTIIGGQASASRAPYGNTLVLNDRVMHAGAIGVSVSGAVRVDTVVSQGCRAFGPTAVITKARGNVIFELGGRATQEIVREAIESLGESARNILQDGLLVGLVINEYKERFGRDDFLIRNVVGLDSTTGGIAIADIPRVGQTIRFHHRDKTTASEDLALLMDAQRLHERPEGCLLITCNGRGQKLFGKANHDAGMVMRAFSPAASGEELARGGRAMGPAAKGAVAMAGFFGAGEIGPVGGQSFLHGHTACLAVLRAGEASSQSGK